MNRRIVRAAALFVACFVAAVAWPPAARADDAKKGRAHAKAAKAYFEAGDYSRAAQESQVAYDLDHLPSRLYNQAVCHENTGDRRRALELYQRYLQIEPNGQAAQVSAEAVASIERQL